MAKILSFRNRNGDLPGQDFLTDDADTLSFRTAEDGAVSLGEMPEGSLPGPLPDPRRDWTNQELADLFRVRRLLAGAGVPVDTLRGATDEGDPWFVFCHLNGDVFIHMARIDGAYVLDSPNVHRPLRGRDFNELIADFTSDVLPARAATGNEDGESTARVIRLERGGKLRLHPSAMLAALIWTLYLASEELVMMVPGEERSAADDLLDFAGIIATDPGIHTLETDTADMSHFALQGSEGPDILTDSAEAGAGEAPGQMREVMAQQGLAMHQNAFAIGLSTIAIAMGFMSEAVLLDNQRKVLDGLKNVGFTQYMPEAEAGPELAEIAGESGTALLDMLAGFLGVDFAPETDMAEAPAMPETDALSAQGGMDPAARLAEAAAAAASRDVQDLTRDAEEAEHAEAPADLAPAGAAEGQETLIAMAIAEQEARNLTMSELLGGQLELEEFQLGQTTILASFDVTQGDAFSLSDYLFFGQRMTEHREFDAHAQAFIDYIQSKDTEVGIVTIGNEIIMIDRGAFAEVGAETYSFSWETYDGQIISMIGLRSEFQEFDLIA